MTLLNIENLRTHFTTSKGNVQAVNGVDLDVGKGEIVGIVGESGSGKTVLSESIMGLVDDPGVVEADRIELNGDDLLGLSENEMNSIRGKDMSMIFQDPMNSLNPILTVGEQISEVIRSNHDNIDEPITLLSELKRKLLGANKKSESWLRAIEMLDSVEIPEPSARASEYPHQFSGGMRQRAMIAMALSCEPDLLIADEPTTALDVTIQAQILEQLNELKSEFNTSILLITHDLGVVAEVCDRVNVMYAGEIVEKAPVEELFKNPQHPYTEALIQSIPTLEDTGDRLYSIDGTVPELIDIPFACHFAPRCPEAKYDCLEIKPEFREVGTENHQAACLRRGSEEEKI